MSHVWIPDGSGAGVTPPLDARVYSLTSFPPRPIQGGPDSEPAESRVRLVPVGDGFALVAGARRDVSVNGMPLALGFAVLSDRDEIAVAGAGRAYWSAEREAAVVEFSAGETPLQCPRCLRPIETGQAAVQCPGCGVWHHQEPGCECFTYAPTCALCSRTTALGAGLQWVPDGL